MSIIGVIIIGVALAMDAFGVTLSVGVNTYVIRKCKILYLISFGFFQGLFAFIGGALGYYIDNYVVTIPHLIGSIVLSAVGTLMIIDGFKEKESKVLEKKIMCLIMGISVSIDALVVGFTTFHHIGSFMMLFLYSSIISLVTLLLCYVGFILCKYIRKISFIEKYADFFGGVVLIIFAIKMFLF